MKGNREETPFVQDLQINVYLKNMQLSLTAQALYFGD